MGAFVYALDDEVDFARLTADSVSVFDTDAHTNLCAENARSGFFRAIFAFRASKSVIAARGVLRRQLGGVLAVRGQLLDGVDAVDRVHGAVRRRRQAAQAAEPVPLDKHRRRVANRDARVQF